MDEIVTISIESIDSFTAVMSDADHNCDKIEYQAIAVPDDDDNFVVWVDISRSLRHGSIEQS